MPQSNPKYPKTPHSAQKQQIEAKSNLNDQTRHKRAQKTYKLNQKHWTSVIFEGFTSLQLRFTSVNFSLTSLQLRFGFKKATSLIPSTDNVSN